MNVKTIIDLFDKWKQTRRLRSTKQIINDSLTDPNLRVSAEKILLVLKDNLNKPFDPKLALGVRVKSTLSDFSKLASLLKLINNDLSKGQILSASRSGEQLEDYSLDELFIDSKGYYIDWLQVTSFCEEALKMCEFTEGYENHDHGMEEHNLRMLSKVFVTVRSISSGLLEVLLA